jgi:hypothetical protein
MNLRASQFWLGIVVFVAIVSNFQSNFAYSAFVSVSNPNASANLSVQISFTGSDLLGTIRDPSRSSDFVLNPVANSAFGPGGPVAFQVAFNSGTGSVSLMVDFNRDGEFSVNEKLTIGSTEMPAMEEFGGKTFEYLSVSAFDSSSSRKSVLTNLKINDNSFGAINSGGGSRELFFQNTDFSTATDILVSGNLILNNALTDRGRTTWKIDFSAPTTPTTMAVTVIPEPVGFSLFIVGGIALSLSSHRRFRTRAGN